jgi:adenine-specific DNA-methyltransferase
MELQLFEQSWMDVWDGREPHEPVGAVFTKPEIVRLILDLAGYKVGQQRLSLRRVLEPSCGDGAFLTLVIERLIESEKAHTDSIKWSAPELGTAIRACDLNSGFISIARETTVATLCTAGCPPKRAKALAEEWIVHADFLLTGWSQRFDYVVGNPPYVRIEELPPFVLQRYRELYSTCTDRADLYVAFFEQGLRLLTPTGCLAFICANRFAKNQYGRRLRELIARDYRVRYYLNLEHTQPFAHEVSAYPCITVLDREHGGATFAATLEKLDEATLVGLSADPERTRRNSTLVRFPRWYDDGAPWIATQREQFDHLHALADRFPTLEESGDGTQVGIGVATGADDIYVREGKSPEIEDRCQLPLIMAGDISPTRLDWSGHYLIDPFDPESETGLRDLAANPGLHRYFETHRAVLQARHVAKKRPQTWYRTIDRVNHALVSTPKLVIPDIQAGGNVGYDAGRFYPHHNVYWITSRGWNLRALQALLRSTLVLEQIRAYSVQMRGGSLRYQAQVLRKLRLPHAASLSRELSHDLAAHAGSSDQSALDHLAHAAFQL